MSEKTEVMRLTQALSAAIKQVDADDDVIHVARWFVEDADAELRRLAAVEAQRDALLEALRDLMARLDPYDYPDEQNFARAAIKAVEEEA